MAFNGRVATRTQLSSSPPPRTTAHTSSILSGHAAAVRQAAGDDFDGCFEEGRVAETDDLIDEFLSSLAAGTGP